MKNKLFSIFFKTFFLAFFLLFSQLSFSQSSASCGGITISDAGNGSISVTAGTVHKIELQNQNWGWDLVCESGNCSGTLTVPGGADQYKNVKLYADNNCNYCQTDTELTVTSGGGNSGNGDCSLITSWTIHIGVCIDNGTVDENDDSKTFHILTDGNTNETYDLYLVDGGNPLGQPIAQNLPIGTNFQTPSFPVGTFPTFGIYPSNALAPIFPSDLCLGTKSNNAQTCEPDPNSNSNSCAQWTGDCNTTGNISRTGKITVNRLDVTDIIHSNKVYVHLPSDFPDYVFEEDYDLMPLDKLASFIENNNRLPNIPSANEVAEKGIDVANLQAKQMEKIEELTLYIIELNKKINHLEKKK